MIKTKRIYDSPSKQDGFRVLVDRIWPRGIKKNDASIDLWLKEIAPSAELRRWFNHDPEKWKEFCIRYSKELNKKKDEISFIKEKGNSGNLTLIF